MADRQLHRTGEENPILSAVDSATVIEIGDLLYLDTDDAKNAFSLTWNTSLLLTQHDFHDIFLGVAAQRSRALDVADIRVATEGVFEFDCTAATFELGDLVGPDDTGGSKLEDQKVIGVAAGVEGAAIGRVAKRYGSNTTKVLVRIESTIATGGVQAAIT